MAKSGLIYRSKTGCGVVIASILASCGASHRLKTNLGVLSSQMETSNPTEISHSFLKVIGQGHAYIRLFPVVQVLVSLLWKLKYTALQRRADIVVDGQFLKA